MKKLFLTLVICAAIIPTAQADSSVVAPVSNQDVVHHPVPKKPLYVSESWYYSLKKSLPPLPEGHSAKQKEDERELFEYQKSRTPQDCERGKSEVFVSLPNFFGSAGSPFAKAEIEKLSPFFEQIRNDADYFIQKLKKDFPRQRPFLYLKGLEPCVPKEVTGAYPSGHAVLSKLFALVLNELYPNHRTFIDARSQQIADHRVLVGMHHRTDVDAGKKLAVLIFEQFKKSSKFQNDLQAVRKSPSPKQ